MAFKEFIHFLMQYVLIDLIHKNKSSSGSSIISKSENKHLRTAGLCNHLPTSEWAPMGTDTKFIHL